MNRRIAKLLSQYAAVSKSDLKELKKWWNQLSWQERTVEKKRIEAELGLTEETPQESETPEE
ncbi:MAG: hypothetical protein D6748_14945 [Calditrichaeota bacterium]|nr:MAG: hypothetical protein D6748_14945 [Calditrichota bacterium]